MPSVMETYVENRWIVQPNHANILGTTHGGNVLKWMDEVGAMAAMRFAGRSCVTARMDQVNFTRPIPLGDIALIEAFVYDTGRTSVNVRLRAFREDPKTGDREPTTESHTVYVAVDDGNPTATPDLTVESDAGKRKCERARADQGFDDG